MATLCGKTKMIVESATAIDPTFKILAVFPEMQQNHQPIKKADEVPTTARGITPYGQVSSPWQLIQVRPGQKTRDGQPKKQGSIYVTYRLQSQYSTKMIMGYLLPELDTKDIRLNLKGVQLPDTETRWVLFGVNPDSCPEGLKYMYKYLVRVELKAKCKRGECSRADAEGSGIEDLFFRIAGLRTSKLAASEDRARYGVEGFASELKLAPHIETPVSRTALHAMLLKSSSNSGVAHDLFGSRATPAELPANSYNISQANSISYMSKIRTHMAVNFHHNSAILVGISNICRKVRTRRGETI